LREDGWVFGGRVCKKTTQNWPNEVPESDSVKRLKLAIMTQPGPSGKTHPRDLIKVMRENAFAIPVG